MSKTVLVTGGAGFIGSALGADVLVLGTEGSISWQLAVSALKTVTSGKIVGNVLMILI